MGGVDDAASPGLVPGLSGAGIAPGAGTIGTGGSGMLPAAGGAGGIVGDGTFGVPEVGAGADSGAGGGAGLANGEPAASGAAGAMPGLYVPGALVSGTNATGPPAPQLGPMHGSGKSSHVSQCVQPAAPAAARAAAASRGLIRIIPVSFP
jgi:hypothetical protein